VDVPWFKIFITDHFFTDSFFYVYRDKEAAFLAKRDDVSSGTQWERINRHLDSSPAAVAAAAKAGRRDTSRMRELLRDLEKDPNAPGK